MSPESVVVAAVKSGIELTGNVCRSCITLNVVWPLLVLYRLQDETLVLLMVANSGRRVDRAARP